MKGPTGGRCVPSLFPRIRQHNPNGGEKDEVQALCNTGAPGQCAIDHICTEWTIAGQVTDSDGEVIVGAIVAVLGLPLKLGASTGTDGEFTIGSVPAGTHMVEASLIGYDDESREVTVTSGQTVTANFALSQGALLLNAIVVTGTRSGGRTAMQSATPIDYLEGEELDRQGNGDLTDPQEPGAVLHGYAVDG